MVRLLNLSSDVNPRPLSHQTSVQVPVFLTDVCFMPVHLAPLFISAEAWLRPWAPDKHAIDWVDKTLTCAHRPAVYGRSKRKQCHWSQRSCIHIKAFKQNLLYFLFRLEILVIIIIKSLYICLHCVFYCLALIVWHCNPRGTWFCSNM